MYSYFYPLKNKKGLITMSNSDYIGKYVKKFESGSKGSLALSSCGNDWGLSCGSYQLTLRWGNCIRFLKNTFQQKRHLYILIISEILQHHHGQAHNTVPVQMRLSQYGCNAIIKLEQMHFLFVSIVT